MRNASDTARHSFRSASGLYINREGYQVGFIGHTTHSDHSTLAEHYGTLVDACAEVADLHVWMIFAYFSVLYMSFTKKDTPLLSAIEFFKLLYEIPK